MEKLTDAGSIPATSTKIARRAIVDNCVATMLRCFGARLLYASQRNCHKFRERQLTQTNFRTASYLV